VARSFGSGPASLLLVTGTCQIIDVVYTLKMEGRPPPPRFTFYVAGVETDMNMIKSHMETYGRTPLFDRNRLALKDSVQLAVRSASRHVAVTHALMIHIEPTMLLNMMLQGHATRSFRNNNTGLDLHRSPVRRYRLVVNVFQLTHADLLFSCPRSPSPGADD
jgi:hypothetical protein